MEPQIELRAYGYHAVIDPNRGANLIQLKKGKACSVRTPSSPDDYEKQGPFFWGTPILFPPNRISKACFEFEGREYRFPVNEPETGCFLHGNLHKQTISCQFQSETEAVFLYKATPVAPYLQFPHAFTVSIHYQLQKDGIHQQVLIRNDSKQNMPLGLGFHTTFALPFVSGGNSQDVFLYLDVKKGIVRSPEDYLPTGEVIEESDLIEALRMGRVKPAENKMSHHFEMGDSREMILTDSVSHTRIRYHASNQYRYWMLYKGNNSGFLCVEPQSWMINSPNSPFERSKTGFDFLSPGERRMYETVLSIEMNDL